MANNVTITGWMTKFIRHGEGAKTWVRGGVSVSGGQGKPLLTFAAFDLVAQRVLKLWNPGGAVALAGYLEPEAFDTTEGRRYAATFVVTYFEVLEAKKAAPKLVVPDLDKTEVVVKTREDQAAEKPNTFKKRELPGELPDKPMEL